MIPPQWIEDYPLQIVVLDNPTETSVPITLCSRCSEAGVELDPITRTTRYSCHCVLRELEQPWFWTIKHLDQREVRNDLRPE